MRIVHEDSKCASTGMCEEVAPQLFQMGSAGELLLLDPTPSAALRGLVEEAVAVCPTQALRIQG